MAGNGCTYTKECYKTFNLDSRCLKKGKMGQNCPKIGSKVGNYMFFNAY